MNKNFGQNNNHNKGIVGISLAQALQGNNLQNGKLNSMVGFNQNLDSSSQLKEDSSEYNRIDTLQQIDDNNMSIGHIRMDTSISGLNQNQYINKTQQNSSKGNLHSQTNFPNESEFVRNRDYSLSKRIMTTSQGRQSNHYNNNNNNVNNTYNGDRYQNKRMNHNKHVNGSFYSQKSEDVKRQDKFGFIKAESLYGNNQNEGLFNSDMYMTSLQDYLKTRNDKKNKRNSFEINNKTKNNNSMNIMQEHIEYTNELQKRFIEQSMNSIDTAAHERFLKYENNEQSILNKLNKHIIFTKERDHIHQLTKAEFMKNSFIPCKQDDDIEITNVSVGKINNNKSNKNNQSKESTNKADNNNNQQKNHNEEFEIKLNQQPQLIHVHKDSENNIINRLILDEPNLQNQQSSLRSSAQNSYRNTTSSKQQQIVLKPSQYSKEIQSPTRLTQQNKLSSDNSNYNNMSIEEKLLSHRSNNNESNNNNNNEVKQIPFLKQQTLIDQQIQQEQLNEKQMLQKNRKALKNKISSIIQKHQKVNKDIDYAYQEVTEQIKKKELLQRMRSISDSQTPNTFNFSGTTPVNNFMIPANESAKNNLQRLGKLVMNKNTHGFAQAVMQTTNYQGNLNKQRNSILAINNNNQIQTPNSNSGHPSALQSLELQKKAFIEGLQNVQNENKIYFQPQYKIREKGLMFDLSNINNKEQVLDRVLMNYFHQQDLLNEQENILKKANRNSKSGRSASIGKSYKTKELGSLLSKFKPQHIRLHLKDLQKGVSGLSSSGVQSNNKQTRVIRSNSYMNSNSNNNGNSENIDDQKQDYYQNNDENNVDFNVFKEKYQWKKQQNQIINYSKICSPAEMVLQFMKQDPRFKKQQNIEAIDFLIQFDPQKVKEEGDMEDMEEDSLENKEKLRKRFDDSIMRRIFFFYSNKNDANTSDRFQEVDLKSFLTFFITLSGQNLDLPLDLEPTTPFLNKSNIFNQQDNFTNHHSSNHNINNNSNTPTNEISFFGHLLNKNKLRKLDIPNSIGDLTNKNKEQNKQQLIQLGDSHIEISTLKIIFERITSKKEKQVLNYYEFLEAIRKTSVQYYLQKISQDNIPQPQELFEKFFIEFIKPKHMSFFDQEEQELLKMREHKQIDQLLKLFESNLKDLFIFAGSMRSQNALDFSQIYLGFQEVYEILQKLDFFPNKISKTTIRYIYYYTLCLDQGLDFHDFCQCLHLIGLRIIRYPLKNTPVTQTPQQVYNLQRQCREIQYTIFKLKQDGKYNNYIEKFIQDISLFYVHKDYIEFQKIQQKIIDIKESNQKQLQMM